MAASTSAQTKSSTDAEKSPITEEQLLFEKLSLRGCFRPDVNGVSSYKLVVCGLMVALQGFCENLRAETLNFKDLPENDVKGKQKQCQILLTALNDVKCPFNIKMSDLLKANIPVMKPVIEWVLRKGLLLECEDNTGKKQHANYFFKTFKNEAEATTEYLKRFNGDKDESENSMPSYFMFCDKIVQKNVGGTQILGVYLLFNKMSCVTILLNSKKDEGKKKTPLKFDKDIHVPTIKELQAKDKGEILKYRTKLAERIDELDIDGIIDSLEARLKKEAQAYFLTRKELIFIEGHLATADLQTVKEDEHIAGRNLTKSMHQLTTRIREFKISIDEDLKSSQRMVTRFEPKLDEKGEEIRDPTTYELYTKYQKFTAMFKKIVTDCDKLDIRLSDQATEIMAIRNMDGDIEAMEYPPELTSQDYFIPIDESIADDIIRINHRVHTIVKEDSLNPPTVKGAKDYYEAFISYVIDSMFKLSEIYWKAELMHHNRAEEKKRVENLRERMKTRIRDEVKSDILMEVLHHVTLTVHTVDNDLDNLKKDSYKVRGKVLDVLNASKAQKNKKK